jgi:hypothetical protein
MFWWPTRIGHGIAHHSNEPVLQGHVIPKFIFLLEDTQRKAASAHLLVTNQTLTILSTTALLAADIFPRTTKPWEELDPADKTWAAWKTAYLAAHNHKKRANCLHTIGGADNLGQANSNHANNNYSGLLNSIDNALDNLASTVTNEKAILKQLIATKSSLATSNTTLTNQVKALREQLVSKTKGGGGRGGGSNDPNRKKGPDPTGYCWLHGYQLATPVPIPRKATSPPPLMPTSWVDPWPTRTGCPTRPPEAQGWK